MTPHRFRQLLDAYGADIERWPAAERARARMLAAQAPADLRESIEQARRLDDWLGEYQVAPPSTELETKMTATALASSIKPVNGQRLITGWLGLGLAGIGLAGLLAGAVAFSAALSIATPKSLHEGLIESSDIFGVSAIEWSDL